LEIFLSLLVDTLLILDWLKLNEEN